LPKNFTVNGVQHLAPILQKIAILKAAQNYIELSTLALFICFSSTSHLFILSKRLIAVARVVLKN
jgi:hypothetical protein